MVVAEESVGFYLQMGIPGLLHGGGYLPLWLCSLGILSSISGHAAGCSERALCILPCSHSVAQKSRWHCPGKGPCLCSPLKQIGEIQRNASFTCSVQHHTSLLTLLGLDQKDAAQVCRTAAIFIVVVVKPIFFFIPLLPSYQPFVRGVWTE